MNDQEIRDRINKVCSILSDSHMQCMYQALKADALIAKAPLKVTLMAKSSITRTRELMNAHASRMLWAVDEMDQLLKMEM